MSDTRKVVKAMTEYFTEDQLAQLVGAAGLCSGDEMIPFALFSRLADYLEDLGMEPQHPVVCVDAEKVGPTYEMRVREGIAYPKFVYVKSADIHFNIDPDEENLV